MTGYHSRMLRSLRFVALLAVALFAPAAWAGELKLYFLDVGQGDSELIVSPTGKTVLIDAGPPEAGPKLRARLERLLGAPLDLVILTHPHLDHLGGMEQALEVRGAKVFMDSGFNHPSPQYESLLHYLAAHDIKVLNATQGRNIDLGGGAMLSLLGPPQPFLTNTRSDPNANSIVARLAFGKRHFLFVGDAEEPTEQMLLKQGDLRSDVLKVAHHGSRHSSTPPFLEAVKPSIAVIEVGTGNDYGHPTEEALSRLTGIGAKIYRTDLDGEVRVTCDGEHLSVSTDHTPDASSMMTPGTKSPDGTHHRRARSEPLPVKQVAAAEGYVASRRGKVFHRAGCPGGERIKAGNKISFPTRDAAVSSGLEPAKDCNP